MAGGELQPPRPGGEGQGDRQSQEFRFTSSATVAERMHKETARLPSSAQRASRGLVSELDRSIGAGDRLLRRGCGCGCRLRRRRRPVDRVQQLLRQPILGR